MVTTRGATSIAIQQFEHDAKNGKLNRGDFVLLEFLGQGGEGSVFHAKHKASGMDVALKRIPFTNNWDNEQESRIHVQLQHPNILRMYGMFREDETDETNKSASDGDNTTNATKSSSSTPIHSCWIILEYCREGTMQRVMEMSGFAGSKAKEAFVAKTIHAILCAVRYMHHEHQLMHRDIKPINILMKNGVPMLADFGLCASLKVTESSTQQEHGSAAAAAGRSHDFAGTETYMAPEVLAMANKYRRAKTTAAVEQQQHDGGTGDKIGCGGSDKKCEQVEDEEWRKGYSFEADPWSLGVTTHELLVGKHPFPIHDNRKFTVEMCRFVDNNFAPCAIAFPTDGTISAQARCFILSLVQVDRKKRMSVDDALRHPWILRHDKQGHSTTATVATTTKDSKPAKQLQQHRAPNNKQVGASKTGDNNDDDAAVKQVSTAAATTMWIQDDKENKQQQKPGAPAKNKQVADSSGDNDNDIAVQQVQALFGGLDINQQL